MFQTISPEGINIAIRQIKRWVVAAEQDKDPYVKYLHATYATGNIDLLRDIISDIEIMKATNIDILKLRNKAITLQDIAQRLIQSK